MKTLSLLLLYGLTGTVLAASVPSAQAQNQTPNQVPNQSPNRNRRAFDLRSEGTLKVGDVAPQIGLQDLKTKAPVKLADLKGRPAVLLFGSYT